jgi:cellobiose-specific phosphotransferase system component IIA
MKWITSVHIPESNHKIGSSDRILSLGSCFSENMGDRLERLPMSILNQPLGTLFHPFSIQKIFQEEEIRAEDCYETDGFFVHPDFHSKFTSKSREVLVTQLKNIQKDTWEFCQEVDWIIITWGTAYQYFDKKLQRPIANCHKQAMQQFEKRLSTSEELIEEGHNFFRQLKDKYPKAKIILTVSPVRHTKDGLMENSVSKSLLRVAAAELSHALSQVHYFPSYELMLDELRDYRFYQADLIHPNELAIEYIWEKFKATYFANDLLEIDKAWTNYLLSIHHRVQMEKQAIHNALLEKIWQEIQTKYADFPIHKMGELIKSRILPNSAKP